jgi:aspartate/methionine/tyrosine aminotransferase
MNRLGTESAFEVLAQAKRLEAEGKSVVHLEIGEPDFATPENIINAAVAAMHAGFTHYTPSGGIWEVREATAAYVSRTTGAVGIGPENVVLVPGSKNILHFALLSLINEGDEVIVPDPGYPIYASLASFVGAKVVHLPVREENDFRVDIEELKGLVGPKTKMIIINSPQNPTGGVLTRSDLEAIAELAIKSDLVVLSDEIYSRLIYDGDHVSMLSIPGMEERTILMDGLSKAWAMCGWRLGYGVMPIELAKRMQTLMINSSSCAAAFTQMAAIEAFNSPESDESVVKMRQEFYERRQLIVDGLNEIPGVHCHQPHGAFYVFPNISETGWGDRELAKSLLNDSGLACLAGSSFGAQRHGFLRFSYANSKENINSALERLANHLKVSHPVAAGV